MLTTAAPILDEIVIGGRTLLRGSFRLIGNKVYYNYRSINGTEERPINIRFDGIDPHDRTYIFQLHATHPANHDLLHDFATEHCAFLYFLLTESVHHESYIMFSPTRPGRSSYHCVLREFINGVLAIHGMYDFRSVEGSPYLWHLIDQGNVPFDGVTLNMVENIFNRGFHENDHVFTRDSFVYEYEKDETNMHIMYQGVPLMRLQGSWYIADLHFDRDTPDRYISQYVVPIQAFLLMAVTPNHGITWRATTKEQDAAGQELIAAYVNGFLLGALMSYRYKVVPHFAQGETTAIFPPPRPVPTGEVFDAHPALPAQDLF